MSHPANTIDLQSAFVPKLFIKYAFTKCSHPCVFQEQWNAMQLEQRFLHAPAWRNK